MSHLSLTEHAVDAAAPVSLYRAIWRWHFFAGLLVVPFMISLALSGSIYLFKDEINDTVFAYRYIVAPDGPILPPSKLVEDAAAAVPGSSVTSYRSPAAPNRSVVVTVTSEDRSVLVFVDPHDGRILDRVASSEEFNTVIKHIHSLDYFGSFANRLIEMVAGFVMVLVVTGIYLWWPRRQSGGVITVRGTPSRRVFWRDLHAVTGATAGVAIFFLALTGMPWSGYWGANANAWLTSHGLGYPVQLWDDVPKSQTVTQQLISPAGWLVENAPVPLSAVTPGPVPEPVGLDRAVEIVKSLGIAPGFEMAVPSDASGVYTAAVFPEDLSKQRTIHIDQYSGRPLVDLSFEQYPVFGKAIEWGINVHQGQEWGLFNQLLMLATCAAIVLSCVTAVVMWWKRRPTGRVGVPPMPPRRSVYLGLWLIAAVFAVAFPITGIAIVAMIAFDLTIVRFVPPLRRLFS